MYTKIIKLYSADEYNFPTQTDFIPFLKCFLHEDNRKHPAMIIVPGGAYRLVSASEGELPALKFYKHDFNVFVCVYTTNFFQDTPLYDQPLKELSKSVQIIRYYQNQWNISSNKIVACGFSAGGHIVANLGNHADDISSNNDNLKNISNRLNAMILCYPVISMTSSLAHSNSLKSLLGNHPSLISINYWSAEKNIKQSTPPSFVWTTATDSSVKVDNSYEWFKNCQIKNIPCALHIFSQGKHGLSLANTQWQKHKNNINYTMEQLIKLKQTIPSNSDKFKKIDRRLNTVGGNAQPNLEVIQWVNIALNFINLQLH